MRSRKYLRVAIVIAFLWSGQSCLGTGLPALRIFELVNQSDVVVVADVGELKPIGPAGVMFGDTALLGERYRIEGLALYRLVGSCPDEFSVEFVLPNASTSYRSVKTGTRLLFLKKSGTTYNPTSLYFPDFPAVRSEPAEFQGLEGAELVFAELGAAIASSAASPEYKWEVLRQSFAIPASNKLFLNDLLVGLQNTSDPDLHHRIQAELISRNDLSQLPDVSGVLLSDTLSETQKDLLLFTIGRDLKSERALPALVRLLQSSDPKVRVASTQALWHTASPSSISIAALAQALNDKNPEVRYYAIRGLADATGEQQWGPGPAEYEAHEAKYRQHWLEWTTRNSAIRTNK